jgi:hypothetical protein
MTSPNLSDSNPETHPPKVKTNGRPWAQIGILFLNIGFYLMALDDFLGFTPMTFPAAGKTFSGYLILGGLVLYGFSPKYRRGARTEESVPYSLALHQFNLAIFGGTMSMVTLTLMIPAIYSAQKSVAQNRKSADVEVNGEVWQTFTSAKTQFAVDIPPGWIETTDPAYLVNDVSCVDLANDISFFMLSIPKEDVTHADLEEWSEATLTNVRATFTDSEVIERTTYTSPGPLMIELLLNGTNQNVRFVSLMRFIEAPNHYLWARVIASRSGFRAREDSLRKIIRSVRLE